MVKRHLTMVLLHGIPIELMVFWDWVGDKTKQIIEGEVSEIDCES